MKQLLLSILLVCGFSSHAQTMYQATFHGEIPKLKDYVELASMAPHKRIAYLQEIRDLLVEMEKTGSKNAEASLFREAVAGLLRQVTLVDTAGADEPAVPRYTGTTWTCPSGYRFSWSVGTCIAITSGRFTAEIEKGNCPAGTHAVHNRDNRRGLTDLCIPAASWNQLPPERRAILENAQSDSRAWLNSRAISGKPEADVRRDFVGSAAPAATRPTDGPPAVPARPRYTPKEAAGFTGGAGGVTCEKLLANNYKQEKQRKDLDKHLNDFGVPSCVIGGAFSGYNENKVVKGKCQAVTVFPPPPAQATEHSLKCDKPGESMCNPLLFCLEPATDTTPKKPICLKIGKSLTYDCDRHASAKNCDPFSDNANHKLPDGTREAWSQFREAFDKMCVPESPFVKYYCIECQKMSQRMIALDKKYGNLQADEVLKDGWAPTPRSTR